MWAIAAVAGFFLVFGVLALLLWWLVGLYDPANTDVEIGTDQGLVDAAVPMAEAYTVRLYDDDVTPMDFVVECLQAKLNLSRDHSVRLMLRVHQHGHADVGRMGVGRSRELAAAMSAMSQEHKHPFRCEAVRHGMADQASPRG
jgi:ATP-dependent Clp protease adapter protein ClpS